MIGSSWILMATIIFNDGRKQPQEYWANTKEECIYSAHQTWNKYYSDNLDANSRMVVVCKNRFNNYDFVVVRCNKNGSCNI